MREFQLQVADIVPHGGCGRDRGCVREFVLTPLDGATLPSHEPGAHLLIHAGNSVNAYSLLDDGVFPQRFRIAVQRGDAGGGSDWLHANVQRGDILTVAGLKAAFSPHPAARHALLIGAGIGITPIIAHARAAARWNRSFSVIYADRDPDPPLLGELQAISGDHLVRVRHREHLKHMVSTTLRQQRIGTHIWACGPSAFLDWLLDEGARAGWVPERLHVEPFEAPPLKATTPFTAVLRLSGQRIDVAADVSLLAALDAAGVALPRMCQRGVCGECATGVSAGTPDHRDLILSREERAAATVMYPCVSRSLTPILELEL